MTDWRTLCAELAQELERYQDDFPATTDKMAYRAMAADAALNRARAALAGGVGELVEALRLICADVSFCDAQIITRAADILTRLALQPVPVSERLPGPEDCDAKGRCWCWNPATYNSGPDWWSFEPLEWAEEATHWLPFHALPLPREVQP